MVHICSSFWLCLIFGVLIFYFVMSATSRRSWKAFSAEAEIMFCKNRQQRILIDFHIERSRRFYRKVFQKCKIFSFINRSMREDNILAYIFRREASICLPISFLIWLSARLPLLGELVLQLNINTIFKAPICNELCKICKIQRSTFLAELSLTFHFIHIKNIICDK